MAIFTVLFVLRGFMVVLLLALIFYVLNPDGSISIEKMHENFPVFKSITENLRDLNYNVPIKDRRPLERMVDYYKNQEKIMMDLLVNTRMKFRQQHFIGTVMRDGFHSDLPDNAMWRGSKIEMGDNIAKMLVKEAEKGNTPVSVSPSPVEKE
jgi:hypothetical protein